MDVGKIELLSAASCAFLTLCACTPIIDIYEPPTVGRMAEIRFVNAARIQEATLTTFDDGVTCTGKHQIYFENKPTILAGDSGTMTAAAGREFALFARLATVEHEEYGVDLSVTGGGPAPAIRRTTKAIGCNANLSFQVEPNTDYQIVLSEPESSASCSIAVSKIDRQGEFVKINTTLRTARTPRDQIGPFCEPLGGRLNGSSGAR